MRNGICVIHNGIIVNDDTVWSMIGKERFHEINTKVIAAITEKHLEETGQLEGVSHTVLSLCQGVVACAITVPKMGKMVIFSNNGSLYSANVDKTIYFSLEKFLLKEINWPRKYQTNKN